MVGHEATRGAVAGAVEDEYCAVWEEDAVLWGFESVGNVWSIVCLAVVFEQTYRHGLRSIGQDVCDRPFGGVAAGIDGVAVLQCLRVRHIPRRSTTEKDMRLIVRRTKG